MPNNLPDKGVTVLICTANGAQRLPQTLAHLARQQVPTGVPWEVLLVSNASTDDTLAVTARVWTELGAPAPLRLLDEPRPGKPGALERGFAEAKYEYICIVDDDNWLAADYVGLVYEIMLANPAIGALGGHSTAVCEIAPPAWFEEFADYYAVGRPVGPVGDITAHPAYVFGAGSAIRKSAWQRVLAAGFKSILVKHPDVRTSGEDVEMCYALAVAGYRIWFDDRLCFQHFIPAGRLNWQYLCDIFKSNAGSEVDLHPYRRQLFPVATESQTGSSRLRWLRNGLYTSRSIAAATWQAVRAGHWRARAAAGSRAGLLMAYARWVSQYYLLKSLRHDQGYEQVADFMNRLRALPPAAPPIK